MTDRKKEILPHTCGALPLVKQLTSGEWIAVCVSEFCPVENAGGSSGIFAPTEAELIQKWNETRTARKEE